MPILSNFYIFLGVILVFTIVLSEPKYSLVKKLNIIVIFAVILLWLDKPDWLTALLSDIKMRF